MLALKDFVLLKAIFCEELSEAVLSRDEERILGILQERYSFELGNGFVVEGSLDLNAIRTEHLEELQDDQLTIALL